MNPGYLNNRHEYGIVSIFLHWLVAILVIMLTALGIYMVELDYYDAWYNLAPWWHKALGMFTFGLLLLRVIWRTSTVQPEPLSGSRWEKKLGWFVHLLFYISLLTVCITGYLVATAKGAPVEIFTDIAIPALLEISADQAEFTGWLHWVVAYAIIGLLVLHVLASLKHHFIDKDATLMRMLIPGKTKENI